MNIINLREMKKIILLMLCALTTIGVMAQDEVTYPVITGLGSDKFIITVNDAGQIAGLDLTAEAYSALATATEIRVVTEGNVQLSSADMTRLCSSDFTMATLDLSGAKITGINATSNNPLSLIKNSSTITTIVFPAQNGMIIPTQCFGGENNQIQNVIIPDNEGSYQISGEAFYKCHALHTVSIGHGTTSLGGEPYVVPDLGENYDNPTMAQVGTYTSGIAWDGGNSGNVFMGCENLFSVVLDKDIQCLRSNCFSGCRSLEYIVLPDELVSIGPGAFQDCSALKTIAIPAKMRFWGGQVFSNCNSLTDVYLLGEYIPLPISGARGGPFNIQQTTNFNYTAGPNPTYSQADYTPFNPGDQFTMAILHYPGTATGVQNYRWSGANDYHLVDENGTTWPNQEDIKGPDGFYVHSSMGATGGFDNDNDIYIGWKYFLQGNQNEKRDDIYYITRFKTSRWYSVCFPFDLTVDKFQNAFGAQAALSEFVGFTYDIDGEKETMTIHFDVAAIPTSNKVLLKANHAYMIHPSRLVVDDDNPIQIFNVNNLMEHYRSAEVMTKKQAIVNAYNTASTALQAYIDDNYNGVEPRPHEETEDYRQLKKAKEDAKKLYDEWDKVKDDDEVDQINEALNEEVWYTNEDEQYNDPEMTEDEKYRIRRYSLPQQLNNDVTYYFRGNYIEKPAEVDGRFANSTLEDKKLPAGCYYLGGVTKTFYHRQVAGSKWTPFTAILDGKANSANANPAKAISLSFSMDEIERVLNNEGGIATAIDKELVVRIPLKAAGNAYNMQGQLIGTHGTEGLPKGMYIVNGKKHVVK